MPEAIGSSQRKWSQSAPLTGATPVTLRAAASATNSVIYVRKITLSITSHAAETFLARDTGGPFTIAAHTDAAAGAGVLSVVTWDFGVDGVQLTTGKDFVVLTGATMTGVVYAEGTEVYTLP